MYELDFNHTPKEVTVFLKDKGQVVLSGHVFIGDTVAETYCTVSVQRPHMLQDGMREAMRDALIGVTGEPSLVSVAFENAA